MEINHIDLMAFISFALLGSFGHCMGMCGGIVLSYSTHLTQNKLLAHILYASGKTSSYIILGILAASVGNAFTLSQTLHACLWFILGIIMLVMGCSLLLQNTWINRIEKSLAFSFVKRIFAYALSLGKIQGIFLLGIANGFLPCGLVYVALIHATSTQSIFASASMMAIFGMITLLPLSLISIFGHFLSQVRWRSLFLRLAGVLVIVFSFSYFKQSFILFTSTPQEMSQSHHAHH